MDLACGAVDDDIPRRHLLVKVLERVGHEQIEQLGRVFHFLIRTVVASTLRERVLFIGTQFSILYTLIE